MRHQIIIKRYNFTYPRVRFHHCAVQPKKAVVYLKITALIGAMAFTNSTMTSNKFPMNLPATGALSLVNLIKSLKPCVFERLALQFSNFAVKPSKPFIAQVVCPLNALNKLKIPLNVFPNMLPTIGKFALV